jgi:ribosomal protein S18 acetylase RimI-like enzyme
VIEVRPLDPGDVDAVVERIARQFERDSARCALVNPALSREVLRDALTSAARSTWTAHRDGRLVGHLFGARLTNQSNGTGIWIGPDGASFDDDDVLDALYRHAATRWIDGGVLEHFVWTLDDPPATRAWHELGFARVHLRGVLPLTERRRPLPDGYSLRRGTVRDLELALALDEELDRAQAEGPSLVRPGPSPGSRREWVETLDDPETAHYIVDHEGAGVAQCVTFPLTNLRGSFAQTIHLSGVVVTAAHRRRGVATAMVDAALADARVQNFTHAETSWRVSNQEASRYWRRYGFTPTYVRLHRTIGQF